MKYSFYFALFLTVKAFSIECPDGAYEVKVDLSFSNKKVIFCQKSLRGSLVKHGPEIIFDLSGKELSRNFYKDGIKSTGPTKVSKGEEQSICKGSQEFVRNMIKNLFVNNMDVLSVKKEHKIMKSKRGSGLCRGYPRERLKFFLHGTPFLKKVDYDKQCPFQGEIPFVFDKNVTTEINLRGELNYNQVKMEYKIVKQKVGKIIRLSLNILEAELVKLNTPNYLKFEATQRFEVDIEKIMRTRGTEGFFSYPPYLKILKLNDISCES